MSDYGGGKVLVLYQISNEFGHRGDQPESYNAFYMSRQVGVTLKNVKKHCLALRNVNPMGPDGYHWRVRIDEKPKTSHSSSPPAAPFMASFSWWDVQDENARLPVKEASPSELKRMFSPPKPEDVTVEVTKAAKGAMRSLGKAMGAVAGSASEDDSGAVRTPVICFKLLDMHKMKMDFARVKNHRRKSRRPSAVAPRASIRSNVSVSQNSTPQPARARAPVSAGAPRIPPHPSQKQTTRPIAPLAKPMPPTPPTGNLMDFGPPSASKQGIPSRSLNKASSMPVNSSSVTSPTGSLPNESRAEKLKREYAKKAANSNRVWDEVDQRWVEGPVKNGELTKSAPLQSASPAEKAASASSSLKGISLDASNAIGKSANVQAAVNARVTEMQQSQAKAVEEVRKREQAKQRADAEEDAVRQRLEPKLKAWSEEHGKKKQLRALLANLHTILWDGSGWKQVSLADVLDDSKVKRVYHKASRVVHPDKTGHLDAEKRFVAKRAFDALTQAKVEFDEGAR